jgi:hypothetical protein
MRRPSSAAALAQDRPSRRAFDDKVVCVERPCAPWPLGVGSNRVPGWVALLSLVGLGREWRGDLVHMLAAPSPSPRARAEGLRAASSLFAPKTAFAQEDDDMGHPDTAAAIGTASERTNLAVSDPPACTPDNAASFGRPLEHPSNRHGAARGRRRAVPERTRRLALSAVAESTAATEQAHTRLLITRRRSVAVQHAAELLGRTLNYRPAYRGENRAASRGPSNIQKRRSASRKKCG